MAYPNGARSNAMVWFIAGFIVVATVAAIVAGVMSAGKSGNTGAANETPAPAVTASDHAKGPQSAKVTFIEYGDFQCPACGVYYPLVKQAMQDYGDKVLFVFRNFPLYSVHPNAGIASQAAEAAGLQGKYWEMHDLLYSKQNEWAETATARVVTDHFDGYAQSIGLDVAKFNTDINSDQVLNRIKTDVDGANQIGVNATPTFYVNLKQIKNPQSYAELKSILDAALAS